MIGIKIIFFGTIIAVLWLIIDAIIKRNECIKRRKRGLDCQGEMRDTILENTPYKYPIHYKKPIIYEKR